MPRPGTGSAWTLPGILSGQACTGSAGPGAAVTSAEMALHESLADDFGA